MTIATMPGNKNELAKLSFIGQAANQAAAMTAFKDYQDRKAEQTTRRHKTDLNLFCEYLNSKGIKAGDLFNDPGAWQGITWGLVKGFTLWMIKSGYAISSVNQRLSTVKIYSDLAAKAGIINPEGLAMIKSVSGYRGAEANNLNDKRIAAGIDTRIGYKKAQAVSITKEQARQLKTRENSPQGRRDSLLMCLLLDHGLRCGEVKILLVTDIDMGSGELRF